MWHMFLRMSGRDSFGPMDQTGQIGSREIEKESGDQKMSEKKYVNLWLIGSSPHLQNRDSVPKIMYWVVAALMLPTAGALYFFGLDALRVILLSTVTCLATEFLFLKGRKKDLSALWDGSAIITGILLALTLPPGIKSSYVMIGAFVSIALGKQVFGGLGYNIFNPALVGRAFLQSAFPVAMTTWATSLQMVDATTSATPLGGFKFSGYLTELWPMIKGNVGGCLGETSAILILAGGLILLIKGYIDWKIPFTILLSAAILSGTLHLTNSAKYADPLFHLFAGGLLLGAIFMATDMVTSPITPVGTVIYGVGIGALVIVIRTFGGLPEGVMYSILIMNAFVPLLNRSTRPQILGEKGRKS
jgi:electron transport complex protein RnfD